jgi:hypothetical protein
LREFNNNIARKLARKVQFTITCTTLYKGKGTPQKYTHSSKMFPFLGKLLQCHGIDRTQGAFDLVQIKVVVKKSTDTSIPPFPATMRTLVVEVDIVPSTLAIVASRVHVSGTEVGEREDRSTATRKVVVVVQSTLELYWRMLVLLGGPLPSATVRLVFFNRRQRL